MNVTVRKEVVSCKKCEQKVEFLYLSDFAYGERILLYDNGKKYAYINLLKDETYSHITEEIDNILKEKESVILARSQDMVNTIFTITCDTIDGSKVDFSDKRKCENCGCEEFGDLLVEPEEIIDINIPEITHFCWNKLSVEERKQKIISAVNDYYSHMGQMGRTGLEYLGTDGNWYHESVLKEFLRGGSPNPIFNEDAARMTHIPLGGKQ